MHARPVPYSRVKSHDDLISGRRGDSGVQFSIIYIDIAQHVFILLLKNYMQVLTVFIQNRISSAILAHNKHFSLHDIYISHDIP